MRHLQPVDRLQFQDIIAQQLSAAADLLSDVEARLESVAELFGTSQLADALADQTEETSGMGTYDNDASMDAAERRQALADEMVKQARTRGQGAPGNPETYAATA